MEPTVNQYVEVNPLMLFTKTYCPYCRKVKDLFQDLGVSYQAIELDEEDEGDQIQQSLKNMTGHETVPYVYLGGKFIGGCDDVEKLKKDGILETWLDENGIAHKCE